MLESNLQRSPLVSKHQVEIDIEETELNGTGRHSKRFNTLHQIRRFVSFEGANSKPILNSVIYILQSTLSRCHSKN